MGTTFQSNLDRLICLQKQAVRCVENLGPRDHTAPFFTKHALLKINQLYELKLAIYIRGELVKNSLILYQNHLSSYTQYNFRHDHIRVPFCRTNYGRKQLAYLVPSFINAHPNTITIAQNFRSLNCFKSAMKKYLLSLSD